MIANTNTAVQEERITAPKRRLRVLFIAPLPGLVTGQSVACKAFLDKLVLEHDVDVIDLTKQGFSQGVDSLRRVLEVGRIIASVWRRQKRADIVYLTLSQSRAGNLKDLFIYAACYNRLATLIVHLYGGAGIRLLLLGQPSLRRAINDFFLSRLGAVVVEGKKQAEMFERAVESGRIAVIPNFAEDFLFLDEPAIRAKFTRTSPLRLLFLSNHLPGKGHQELLDAYRSLPTELRDQVTIDFAGGFETPDQEKEFVEQIHDTPGTRYRGVADRSAKKELFRDSHVFCLPTYYPYEGQPVSILEAYASGCAVITTDHSGIGNIFVDGANGYSVRTRSVSDVADAIRRALSEPERLLAMAIASNREARAKYRTQHHYSSLLGIVQHVADSAHEIRA